MTFSQAGRAKSPARGKKAAAGGGSGANALYVKGAPEKVLDRCTHARLADGSTVPMSAADRKAVLATVAKMAARPLRCLAMAVREDLGALSDYDGPSHPAHRRLLDPATFVELEQAMVFVGIAGIKDRRAPRWRPPSRSA